MMKRRFREHFRRRLLNLFLRFLKTEDVRGYLNLHSDEQSPLRTEVSNIATPYKIGKPPSRSRVLARPPVFITGRFRSGSTLLWNIFRSLPDCTAYYEPFNERRWFLAKNRGNQIDASHRGVTDYWSEYEGLEELAEYYREDWIRHRLYMGNEHFDHFMLKYIELLSKNACGRPVLQFNRVDFRLPWLRKNFPESPIIHIYRNPRDQWCSVLGNLSDYPANAPSGEGGFPRRFYQGVWVRDLCRQFPFLEDYRHKHQYYNFYFLWKLSYNFGESFSDFSLSMEDLTEDPYSFTKKMLDAIGWSVPDENIDLAFVVKNKSRWQTYASDYWFIKIEKECEEVLENFLDKKL